MVLAAVFLKNIRAKKGHTFSQGGNTIKQPAPLPTCPHFFFCPQKHVFTLKIHEICPCSPVKHGGKP